MTTKKFTLEPINHFPDCVFMKLKTFGKRLLPYISSVEKEIDLKLTIRFGEQVIETPKGNIQFGLKQCQLKLNINGGKIPLEKMGLTAPLTIEIEQTIEQGVNKEIQLDASATAGVRVKGGKKEVSTTRHKISQIYTKGTETQPIWVFRCHEGCLFGQLFEVNLAIVEPTANSCRVSAKLTIAGEGDLHWVYPKGLFNTPILSPNKQAIVSNKLYSLIQRKLQDYISYSEVEV